MKNILTSLEEAVSRIEDGDVVGVGGFNFQNKAMAAVREIVRQGKKDLTLICGAPSSIDADILVGAGCVREIIVQSVSLERFGPVGPGFRRRAQAGEIKVVDADQGCVNAGLWASKSGLDSQPSLAPIGADFERVAPHWFRSTTDPFTGRHVVAVRAMRPDVSIVHAGISDAAGHAQQLGSVFNDRLLCGASKRVIVTTEQVVPTEVIRDAPERTFTWAHNTMAVVEVPYGAHPTASHGRYPYDAVHLREYAARARTAEGFEKYAEEFIHSGGWSDYLETVGIETLTHLESRRRLVAAGEQ